MKKLLLSVLCAGSLASAVHAQTASNILVLDVGAVFNQYVEAISAAQKFQALVEEAQGQINTQLQSASALDAQAKQLDAQANDASIAVPAREEYKKQRDAKILQLQDLVRHIETMKQTSDQLLSTKRAQFLQIQFKAIRDEVERIAKARKANLVLNTAGVNVVFAEPTMDITNEVVSNLNAAATSNPGAVPPSLMPGGTSPLLQNSGAGSPTGGIATPSLPPLAPARSPAGTAPAAGTSR